MTHDPLIYARSILFSLSPFRFQCHAQASHALESGAECPCLIFKTVAVPFSWPLPQSQHDVVDEVSNRILGLILGKHRR